LNFKKKKKKNEEKKKKKKKEEKKRNFFESEIFFTALNPGQRPINHSKYYSKEEKEK